MASIVCKEPFSVRCQWHGDRDRREVVMLPASYAALLVIAATQLATGARAPDLTFAETVYAKMSGACKYQQSYTRSYTPSP